MVAVLCAGGLQLRQVRRELLRQVYGWVAARPIDALDYQSDCLQNDLSELRRSWVATLG